MFGAALDGFGDWRAVAVANGVSAGTAYSWIRRWEQPPKMRGGARHNKGTDAEVEKLFGYLEAKKLPVSDQFPLVQRMLVWSFWCQEEFELQRLEMPSTLQD